MEIRAPIQGEYLSEAVVAPDPAQAQGRAPVEAAEAASTELGLAPVAASDLGLAPVAVAASGAGPARVLELAPGMAWVTGLAEVRAMARVAVAERYAIATEAETHCSTSVAPWSVRQPGTSSSPTQPEPKQQTMRLALSFVSS